MGSTVRSLIVAARVDATGMDAGYGQAVTKTKAFQTELGKINAEIKAAQASAVAAKGTGYWPAERAAGVIRQLKNERAEFIANTQLKQSLDRTYYVSTHTNLEVQLADRRAYYAELRTMHQNNAEMMMRIDRAQMTETAAMRANAGGGGGFSGVPGRRAVRMMLMNSVGGAAGPEIGQGIAYGMMAEMMGASAAVSGAIGVGAAGAVAISEAYKRAVENAKELLSIQREYNNALFKAAEELRNQAKTTPVGEKGRSAIATLQEARQKALQDAADANQAGTGFFGKAKDLWALGMGKTTSEDVQRAANRTANKLTGGIANLLKSNTGEEKTESTRIETDNRLLLEQLKIEGQINGPIKERNELDLKHRQERTSAYRQMKDNPKVGDLMTPLKVQQAQEDANLAAKQALDVVHEREHMNQEVIKASMTGRNQEIALLKEKHDEELAEYQREGRDVTILKQQQEAENKQLSDRFDSEDISEHASAMEAKASLIKDNYDREVEMLRIKQEEELRLYRQEGKDIQDLLARQAAEREAIVEAEKDWVKGQLDELDPQRQYDDYMKKINDAKKAGAIDNSDAKTLEHKWDKPIDDQIKELAVERSFQQHKISHDQEQAELIKLRNPLASDERIRELVALQKLTEKPLSTGEFSTDINSGTMYGRRLVDFKALHGTISSPSQQAAINSSLSVSLLQAIKNSLDVIKNAGGLI